MQYQKIKKMVCKPTGEGVDTDQWHAACPVFPFRGEAEDLRWTHCCWLSLPLIDYPWWPRL